MITANIEDIADYTAARDAITNAGPLMKPIEVLRHGDRKIALNVLVGEPGIRDGYTLTVPINSTTAVYGSGGLVTALALAVITKRIGKRLMRK